MSRLRWAFAVYALIFIPLALHHSADPTILGHYSIHYFIFIIAYLAGLAGFLFFLKGSYRRAVVSFSRRILEGLSPIILIDKHYWKLILAAILFHLVLVCVFFRPSMVFSSQPILNVDYGYHYHQVESFAKTLSTEGHTWSYDPFFSAGYPEGTLFDVDMKMVEIGVFILTRLGLNMALSYNAIIFSMFLVIPFILLGACYNFKFSRGVTLLVLIFGVLFWHVNTKIVFFNTVGMCSFVFGTYWTILIASIFYRFLTEDSNVVNIGLFLTLCFGLEIHILMPLLLAPPLASMLVQKLRSIPLKKYILFVFIVLGAFATNGWWIATVIRFMPYRTDTPFFPPPGIAVLVETLITFNEPRIILSVMGIWGFYVYKRRQKMISYMGVTSVAVFILLAYVTKDIPLLGKLEVDRFTVPACVFSVLGLALAMGIVYEEMGFRRLRLRYAFPLVFLIIGFLGTNNMLSLSTVSNRLEDSRKPYKELIAWINNNTSTDGRIAFMDRGDFIRTAGLRYFTNRYFINSPFLYMNLKHGYTAFGHDYFSGQDRFMGRRLQDLNGADLGKYFDLFNIKWIITTRDEAHDFFVKFPQQVKLVKEFTMYQKEKPKSIQRDPSDPEDIEGPEAEYPISIFEVNRKPDYFLRGAGNIRVDYDRLWITMASPGEVIIKYHWMETLAVSPPLPIERYFVDGSPIGFIRVHNGATKDFTIYNSYHVGHQ